MKIADVKEAIKEAERFIKKAKEVRESTWAKGDVHTGKGSASCKRASLDLAVALSKMRRS
jgi:hypothetical protein